MAENCQNCNEVITTSFCGNCGQKKYKRIDRKYIWDEIQYTFLHTNKGFLYSVKNIIKNPGKTAKEFIDGNRVNHYKPILLAFVLSGISAFISFKIIGLQEIMANYYSGQKMNSKVLNDYMSVMTTYNAAIMLSLVPFFALTTKLAFRKWGHNYYEHVVMNSYILCYYTLFSIILIYPLMYIFRENASVFNFLTGLGTIALPFILIFFFKDFYDNKKLQSIIGRVILTMIYTIIGFGVILALTIIGAVVYYKVLKH